MPRPTNRLSALTLKKDLPPGLYADGGGLYLQVSEQKTKAWIFRFTRTGVPRKMGLGPVSVKSDDKRITLADARQKAAAARSLLIDGITRSRPGTLGGPRSPCGCPGGHRQALR